MRSLFLCAITSIAVLLPAHAMEDVAAFVLRAEASPREAELVGCIIIGDSSDDHVYLSQSCDWEFEGTFPDAFRAQMIDVVAERPHDIAWRRLAGECVIVQGTYRPYIFDLEAPHGLVPSGWLLSHHGLIDVTAPPRVAPLHATECKPR